jgi:hypothetical protein
MKPISLPSGTKDVFDIDIIAGFIVAELIAYTWYYVSTKTQMASTMGTSIGFGINANDIAVSATPLIIALVTKDRTRKIMIYAFWFTLAILLHRAIFTYAQGQGLT